MAMGVLTRWLIYLLPLNPMVVRVVQGGSRLHRHMLVRIGYLGTLILLVVFGLLSGGGMEPGASLTDLAKAGTGIFQVIAYGQVVLICLMAPLFMAGAIATERSGRTYDILLTTPLSNLQIVLGTLMGRLFFVLALLASGIPLFAVLLVFGGVPVRSVFMAFATAGLTALTVGAVAVTLSTLRTGGRKAIFVFVVSITAYLLTFYTVDLFLLRPVAFVPNGTTWLTPLHPLLVLEASLNSASYKAPQPGMLSGYSSAVVFYLTRPFATFALLSGVISMSLMLWCAIWLRNVGQGEGRLRPWLRGKLRLGRGDANTERRRLPRGVWQNPVAWREANTRGKLFASIAGRWGFAVLSVLAGCVILMLYHRGNLPSVPDASGALLPQHEVFRMALLTLLLLQLAVATMVAIYMSAGCISREREDGTLDLMLTTPITPKAYVWGKLRGLVSFLALLLAAPVITLAIVSLYTQIGSALQWPQARVGFAAGRGTRVEDLLLLEAPLLLLLVLVPFVAMCVMVAMSWSIRAKGVFGALIPAMALIGCMSLVMGFCGWAAVKNIPMFGTMLNAFSPATNLAMILHPWQYVKGFSSGPVFGRMMLMVSALIAAGGYSLIVHAMLLGIVRNFDQTVRKLSGTG
jgi:ABC-type transport system involved in multi-copper enzyme maturation permease subunit